MKNKPLAETNPYLKDRKTREKLIRRSVLTSSGVEGIKIDPDKRSAVKIPRRGEKRIYKRLANP